MRPKKRVLVYCMDEQRGSVVGFVLRSRGFGVWAAASLAEVEGLLSSGPRFDGVLVLDSGEADRGEMAVSAVQQHVARAPVMLQLRRQSLVVTHAERIVAHGAGMDELTEALRVMVARKRGPKGPGAVRDLNVGAQRAVDVARKAAVA